MRGWGRSGRLFKYENRLPKPHLQGGRSAFGASSAPASIQCVGCISVGFFYSRLGRVALPHGKALFLSANTILGTHIAASRNRRLQPLRRLHRSGEVIATMSRFRTLRFAWSLLLALTGSLISASVSAIVYIGSWDPVYSPSGTPFLSTLGWKGEVTILVPGNCGVSGSGTVVRNNQVGQDCDSFGRAWVVGATVDFYNTLVPSVPIANLAWSFTDLTDAEVNNGVVIEELEFVDAKVTNLRTTEFPYLSAPAAVLTYDNDLSYDPDEFSLQFLLNGLNAVTPPLPGPSTYSGPMLLSTFIEAGCSDDCGFAYYRSEVETEKGAPKNFTFRVPEPAGMSLIAGALLMAGLVGRRRRSGQR